MKNIFAELHNTTYTTLANDNKNFLVDPLTCMVDLHLHLDGAISLDSARELAKIQNIEIPESDTELLKLLRVSDGCRDLNEFLEKFSFPCSLLQTREGIRKAVSNLLTELKTQGLMYCEIRFAPQKHTEKGLTQEQVVQAALQGVKDIDGIDANLILCCMRGDDLYEQNIETINVAQKYINKGVCAVDLAGAEALYPTENFKNIFNLARQKNIPITIHAGEAADSQSVSYALDFGAKRIGHGVRSFENKELLKRLAEEKITLELCPTSNLCTCVFKNLSEYPYNKFKNAGVIMTINTDDPSIEGTDIKSEYKNLIREFNLKKQDIRELLENTVRSAFTDDLHKQKMISKIAEEFN